MENLNRENFWNRLREDYPGEVELFCTWIDAYKKRSEWEIVVKSGVKFHDLPLTFQKGIIAKFFSEELDINDWDIDMCDDVSFGQEVREVFGHVHMDAISREAAAKWEQGAFDELP